MSNKPRPKYPNYKSQFDNLPPQLMTNCTQKDYIQILKESRWNNDYKNKVYTEYLGASSIDGIVYSEYKCSIAMALVLRYILPDFFKSKGLNIDRITNVDSDGDYAPSYSAIEIAPDVQESRLDFGDYFVSNGDQKYIVHLESCYPDAFNFKIGGRKDVSPDVHKLSEEMVKYGEDNNFLKGKKIDPNCNFVKFNRKFTWDDLILPENIKTEIQMNLKNLIEYREVYKANGLSVRRGLILSGQPGTGKTVLAKILCNQIDWTFLWVTSKNLENAKRVSQIINLARDLSPTVIFLEDIDLFGGSRETNNNPMMLGELLNQMDGIEENTDIIIIGSTNNKEVLEKALISRPGRFDKVIDFPLPDYPERLRMLKVFSNGLIDDSLPFLDIVAKEYSKKMTGAQVKELLHMAIIFAIDEKAYDKNQKLLLTEAHFKSAVKAVKGKDFSQSVGFNPTGKSSSIGNRLDDCMPDFD
jgi:cell division protease FtsH